MGTGIEEGAVVDDFLEVAFPIGCSRYDPVRDFLEPLPFETVHCMISGLQHAKVDDIR